MELIVPDWPAPAQVRAYATTRRGGLSGGPFASLNLSDQVGDDPKRVARNRARLCEYLGLPAEPLWLKQVHGSGVVVDPAPGLVHQADAVIATEPGRVCAVMTADCLPLLVCDMAGSRVAAIHAGWRGLAAGVIEQTIAALGLAPERLLVWLGPAIGPQSFIVGEEVRAALVRQDPAAVSAFRASSQGRWYADLFALARLRLRRLGIVQIYGGGDCTFSQPGRFFSYRRDQLTGRQASLIWLAPV